MAAFQRGPWLSGDRDVSARVGSRRASPPPLSAVGASPTCQWDSPREADAGWAFIAGEVPGWPCKVQCLQEAHVRASFLNKELKGEDTSSVKPNPTLKGVFPAGSQTTAVWHCPEIWSTRNPRAPSTRPLRARLPPPPLRLHQVVSVPLRFPENRGGHAVPWA